MRDAPEFLKLDHKTWSYYSFPMHTVTIHEAKATLSKLIEEALSGQEVVIARRNKPLVRIVPLEQPATRRRIGSARGKISLAPDFDDLPEGFEDYV